MATIRRLYKQGNSVVVSVPGWMLEFAGMVVGDEVMMESADMKGMIQFSRWNPPIKEDETKIEDEDRQHLSG